MLLYSRPSYALAPASFLHQVSILKRADLSTSDIAQLADAVEPITFADGEP